MTEHRNPLVSVIIPTYNRAHLIGRAIRSVMEQTFEDWEIMVVDDASTDETPEVVCQFQDPRIHLFQHELNEGEAGARNTGIRQARGRYVGFLDSDDKWHPHKLDRQISFLQANPQVDLVYAGWQWVVEGSGDVQFSRTPDDVGRINGLPRWAFNIGIDFLVKREIIHKHLYNTEVINYVHFDLLLCMARDCRYGFVPETLVSCYTHEGPRLSDRSAAIKAADLSKLIEKHEAVMRSDRRAWSHFNMTAGALYLRGLRQRKVARRHLWRVVIARPLYWKAWAFALASLLPLSEDGKSWTLGRQ